MTARLAFHALSCGGCQVTVLHHSSFPVPMTAAMDACFNCGARHHWVDLGIVELERAGLLDSASVTSSER